MEQGQDAANVWIGALPMTDEVCEGEMARGFDEEDWFYVNVPLTTASASIQVTVCPTRVVVAPWNLDLEVYFLALAGSAPALPVPGQLAPLFEDSRPGVLAAASAEPEGCDSVDASYDFHGLPDNGARWHVRLFLMDGIGLYTFTAALGS